MPILLTILITTKIQYYQRLLNILYKIGKFTKIIENFEGLYVEGIINVDNDLKRKIYILLSNYFLNGLSIGFRVKKYHFENEKRIIEDADLLEISLVKNPANKFSKLKFVEVQNINIKILEIKNIINL